MGGIAIGRSLLLEFWSVRKSAVHGGAKGVASRLIATRFMGSDS
jgi:hypothetical protein